MRFVCLVALFTLALVTPAAASFENSSVVFSSPDDPVGQGIPHLYTDQTASFSVGQAPNGVSVVVQGTGTGPNGGAFNMQFAARPGAALKPGLYKNADFVPGQPAKGPSLDIQSSTGAVCGTVSGWFEVKDIATDTNGAVERLQILYEQHCNGGQPALWGEVRYGEPVTGNAVVTPSELILPETTFGAPTNSGGVAFLVLNPFSFTDISFSGRNAGEFSQAPIACSGGCPNPNGPFAAGDIASVPISFAPARTGTRLATLNVADSSGTTYAVPLQGSTSR
jgi:hypothetical protein